MNYKKLGKILGKIMVLEGALMLAPLLVSIIYKENLRNILAFLIPSASVAGLGLLLQIPKPKREIFYQKEGFALTALVWIIMTLFGAVPFVINGDIPNYIDACFEIMSGFTTTGASIVDKVDLLSRSTLFWRSFSHWIGGMGVLVFVLIFIPESNDGSAMHLLRAESPGPQVGKIVSKMKVTTRILYLIYLGMTVLEAVILMCDKPIVGTFPDGTPYDYTNDKIFFSLLAAFGSAGTGGFGFIPGSMELFSPFSQYVIAIFLILFGVNFSLYYLLLIGKVKAFFKSEELRTYVMIIVAAVGIIFVSLLTKASSMLDFTTEEAFRHSLFQVASIITTTGYTTTDFNLWPTSACTVLVLLMFIGAMAGSTAGGIKTSRIVIAVKGCYVNVRKLINPRYVPKAKFEGKTLEEKTTNDVFSFIALYIFILLIVTLLLSLDGVNDTPVNGILHGFFSNFSSALACLSNIGPAFEAVGPYASYSAFNPFSKVVLTLTMMIGRLEILPVLILFSPKTWKRV